MFQPEIAESNDKETSLIVMPSVCEVCGTVGDHTSDFEVIRHDVAEVKGQLTAIMEVVGMIQAEVSPLMESLQSNPFLKGLLGGK